MLTKEKIQAVQKDIDAALATVAAAHGLAVSPSKIRFDASGFKCATEFAELGGPFGVGHDPKLARNAARFGAFYLLGVEHLGKTFDHPRMGKGSVYVGMSSRDKAVVKSALDGKLYRIDAKVISPLLKRNPVTP